MRGYVYQQGDGLGLHAFDPARDLDGPRALRNLKSDCFTAALTRLDVDGSLNLRGLRFQRPVDSLFSATAWNPNSLDDRAPGPYIWLNKDRLSAAELAPLLYKYRDNDPERHIFVTSFKDVQESTDVPPLATFLGELVIAIGKWIWGVREPAEPANMAV
ncbi:hypothetical protein H0H93_014411 [Arthromyces matolae]|nr:hypothetical protein H0H93_014411 [Arthromyces matolae]